MDPARTAMCLECRTVLAPGEPCDVHGAKRVVDLANASERNRAVDAVWGPPHLRVAKVATAGTAGGVGGGLFEGCGSCGDLAVDGEAAIAILVIVVAAIVAIALYFIIKRIVYWIRAYRARPRPTGSAWRAPRHGRRTVRGTITAATGATAPLSEAACAAWGLVLEHDRAVGGATMLRDGETAGMTVTLEDGRTLAIAAGRVRVEGSTSKEDVGATYLQRVDPHHVTDDAHAVLAHDTGYEVRLAVGDTVEITSGLEERFDPNAPADFRTSAPTQVVVAGVPTLIRI